MCVRWFVNSAPDPVALCASAKTGLNGSQQKMSFSLRTFSSRSLLKALQYIHVFYVRAQVFGSRFKVRCIIFGNDERIGKTCRANRTNRSKSGESN